MDQPRSIAHKLLHQSAPSSLQPQRAFWAGRAALLFPDQAEVVGGLMHNDGTGRSFWCHSWTVVARWKGLSVPVFLPLQNDSVSLKERTRCVVSNLEQRTHSSLIQFVLQFLPERRIYDPFPILIECAGLFLRRHRMQQG